MIVLGIVLLVIGFLATIAILWTLGIIVLVVIGAVLAPAGDVPRYRRSPPLVLTSWLTTQVGGLGKGRLQKPRLPVRQGGAGVGLTEHERRRLDQLETALSEQDPKLARALSGYLSPRLSLRRLAMVLILPVALVLLIIGVTATQTLVVAMGCAGLIGVALLLSVDWLCRRKPW